MDSFRRFGRSLALTLALAPLVFAAEPDADPWRDELPAILARIVPPTFPARVCDVTRYGAKPDGKTDASQALREAIEACHRKGGGRVLVPAGVFLTGPIHLKSRIELHVAAGATLRFSTDPRRYPLVFTRWEGLELMNYSPLIYAFEQEDIAITGTGVLDGGADDRHWWPWKRAATPGAPEQRPARERLFQQAEAGVPVEQRVYGEGGYLRPPFVQTYRCRNVLIEDVTIKASPFWVLHPVLSTNVTVRRVKIQSLGPNNDGCNPESSEDVLIEDTDFDTGDDCIALKSGRNADGRRLGVPVRNVVVRNCRMRAGHGGVTVGSEISGGARRIFVERCSMSSPDLERGLRFKTNATRGGVIEDFYAREIEIGEVQRGALDVDMLYEEGARGAFVPTIRNLRLERINVAKAGWAILVGALENSPLDGLLIKDSVFRGVRHGSELTGVRNLTLENVRIEPAP